MRNAWQCDRTAGPGEFLLLQNQLGISQAALSRYLGVSDRTVRRYVNGDSLIPEAHVLLVRALLHFKVRPLVPRKGAR